MEAPLRNIPTTTNTWKNFSILCQILSFPSNSLLSIHSNQPMGTWSPAINGNDEFQTIYDAFKELYLEYTNDQWPYGIPEIKQKMSELFSFQLENKELAHEFWFAQAKAFWD
jgi:hypothetical protein